MSDRQARIPRSQGSRGVVQLSNELEFNLHGAKAQDVIRRWGGSGLLGEVNPRDVVELNVSLAKDIRELNGMVASEVARLVGVVEAEGGKLYGGSSVLTDTSRLDPKWYRTTSLSKTLARGLMEVSSQQLVIGVDDEQFGFGLGRFLLKVNPVLVAVSASSPYRYDIGPGGADITDTGLQSRRAQQYESMCVYLPPQMWRDPPSAGTMGEYRAALADVSVLVNCMLREGRLDANMEELYKARKGADGSTYSYAPFDRLEPHQVYWPIRIRPDHKNETSVFSLEVRTPDLPLTTKGIQMVNTLVVGLAYYLMDHDAPQITQHLDGTFSQIKAAASSGLDAIVGAVRIREIAAELRECAAQGLREHGFADQCGRLDELDRVLREGNDAQRIRSYSPRSSSELIDRLALLLRGA